MYKLSNSEYLDHTVQMKSLFSLSWVHKMTIFRDILRKKIWQTKISPQLLGVRFVTLTFNNCILWALSTHTACNPWFTFDDYT